MIYDQEMLGLLDDILAEAAKTVAAARMAMQSRGDVPVALIDKLLARRDDMAMRLARYDKGLWMPDDALDDAYDIEDEASDILAVLGLDRPDYESPALRELYRVALADA